MERDDPHTPLPSLAMLHSRRHTDEPITEAEFAALGRAAHAELLRIVDAKARARAERQRQRERRQEADPARERLVRRA